MRKLYLARGVAVLLCAMIVLGMGCTKKTEPPAAAESEKPAGSEQKGEPMRDELLDLLDLDQGSVTWTGRPWKRRSAE